MFIHSRVFHFIAKTDVSEKFLCTKIFQSTADLYNLLHIVNESVDIMYDKRLFSKEVIRNVNYKEEKIGVIIYLYLKSYVCLCQYINV